MPGVLIDDLPFTIDSPSSSLFDSSIVYSQAQIGGSLLSSPRSMMDNDLSSWSTTSQMKSAFEQLSSQVHCSSAQGSYFSSEEEQTAVSRALHSAWMNAKTTVNTLFNSSSSPLSDSDVKDLLLCREGLMSTSCESPRGGMLIGSPSSPEAVNALQKFLPSNNEDQWTAEDVYSCDEFRMFEFKVRRCMRARSHDWTECPFAHPGEKARRRDPRRFHYSGTACPDFRKGNCKHGDSCEYAHGVFECWLHPARYRTQPCKDGRNCKRRVCFFAHTSEQLRLLPSASTTATSSPSSTLQSPSPSPSPPSLSSSLSFSRKRSSSSSSSSAKNNSNEVFDGHHHTSSSSSSSSSNGGVYSSASSSSIRLPSPTSTLGLSLSPPPLSPPLSPSQSPPVSPSSPQHHHHHHLHPHPYIPSTAATAAVAVRNTNLSQQQQQLMSSRSRHLERISSMPTSSSSPSSPCPSSPSSRLLHSSFLSAPSSPLHHHHHHHHHHFQTNTHNAHAHAIPHATHPPPLSDLVNALHNLEINNTSATSPMWLQLSSPSPSPPCSPSHHQQQQQQYSPSPLRPLATSPSTSSSQYPRQQPYHHQRQWEMWEMDDDDEVEEERVESGRDLRAEIYGKLLMKNDPTAEIGPDLNWIDDLVT